jgi:3-hydroxyacyl-[acyl-carrier-protein] dehydratase
MLLQDFYKIISLEKINKQKYVALVLINEKSKVFKGHFTDNPVIPGVCQLQIIKEITEQITGYNLLIKIVSEVKFTALINPEVNPKLRFELDVTSTAADDFKVKNTTFIDETIALKLNCIYKKNVQ